MDDNSLMPFGDHAGKKLKDVPDDYLIFLYDEESGWIEREHPGLYDYIEENLI